MEPGRGGGGGGGGRGGGPPEEASDGLLALRVSVDGLERDLGDEDWEAMDVLSVRGDGRRGGERDAIDLRDLAARVGGPGAVVTRVWAADGASLAIPATAWADPGRVPVLRLNRRGRFKFHWTDAARAPLEGQELRLVEKVDVASAAR